MTSDHKPESVLCDCNVLDLIESERKVEKLTETSSKVWCEKHQVFVEFPHPECFKLKDFGSSH